MEVRVRVRTGQKKEGVAVLPDGRLDVAVREKPREGRANDRVTLLVARYLKVARKSVRITRGHTTPSKTLSVSSGD